jgi:DNA polymerase-3 subunit delta
MLIKPDQLEAHLKQRVSPLYVIHGDEPLFVAEAGDAIRRAAKDAGCTDREIFIVERGFKWDAFQAAAMNLSLFGDKKLIDLRIPTGSPGVEGAAVLQKLAQNADSGQIVLITLPRADKTMQATVWFKALQSAADVIPIFPIEREALPRWISQRFARFNLRAENDAIALLAAQCEGNMLAARQEIEKLALLYPVPEGANERLLTLAEVESATGDVAHYNVFELSEAWLDGDCARALHLLHALKNEGEAPTLMVWQFSEDVHALCAVRADTMKGVSASQAVMNARVWGRRQRAMERAAKRVPNAVLPKLLRRLADLDALAKGLKFNQKQLDIWNAMEEAIVEMTT